MKNDPPLKPLNCQGDIEARCLSENNKIQKLLAEALKICPKLIDLPALQAECFGKWKELSNEQIEIRNAKTKTVISVVGDKLAELEREFKKIENEMQLYI